MVFAIFGFIATTNAQIILTVNLDLDPTSSSNDITAYPNSTIYPNYYEVNLRLSAVVNTFQTGRFYVYPKKRQFNYSTNTWGTWGDFTPNMNVFPNLGPGQTPNSTYTGTAKTTQLEGTKFEYKIEVRFIALDGSQKISTTPVRTATILGVSVPCFTMYNVVSTQTEPSYYGPITVNTICQNAVTINGSCSKFEQGYHIRISEFNAGTWNFVTDYYNTWAGSGEAPSFISINALAASNGYTLVPGKLYSIGFSIGPVWKSAPIQFFRVINTCREGDNEINDPKQIASEDLNQKLKLYPNPTKDNVTLNIEKEDKLISYSIFDNSGLMVKKGEFTSKLNEETINISDLRKGIYLISVETEKTSFREKIIKE